MADQRLSKLQKWILQRCCEEDKKGFLLERSHLVFEYAKYKGKSSCIAYTYHKGEKEYNTRRSIEVTVSKSIRNLAQKGYITLFGNMIKIQDKIVPRPLFDADEDTIPYEDFDILAHKVKFIGLNKKKRTSEPLKLNKKI